MFTEQDYNDAKEYGDEELAGAIRQQLDASKQTNPMLDVVRDNVPGMSALPSLVDSASRSPEQDRAAKLEAVVGTNPYADFRRENINAPFWDRAMVGAGHRATQLGEGLANIGDGVMAAFSDAAQTRLDNRVLNDYDISQYKEDLISDTGAAGVLGEFLPYYMSGFVAGPVVTKAASKVLGGMVDMANVPIKVAGRSIGSANDAWLKSSSNATERIAADLDAGLKARPTDILAQKIGTIPKWMDSNVVDPARVNAAAKIASKKDMPLVPLLAGTGAQMVGQTLLSLGEGAIDSEKTWQEGAIQGAVGAVGAAVARPYLSNAVDLEKPLYKVSTAESELMKRVKRNYGINSDIGMEWGLPSDQVKMANFRHRPGTQNMADQYDANQERKIANMIADGLGMKRPENGFTHADFAAHTAELDKGYKAIADNTYGEFDPGIMGRINTHAANILNDPTIPKDVKDLANKYRLAAHGYQTPDKQLVAATYTPEDHASIMRDLKQVYSKLVAKPNDEEILHAQEAYHNARIREQNFRSELTDHPNTDPKWHANALDNMDRAKAELDTLVKRNQDAPSDPARKSVAKSINDIGKLLHFNTSTQKAGNFITPDNLSIIDNHLSKIRSHLDEVGPRGASYNEVKAAHDEIIKALEPLKSNIATRNDSGNIVVDGSRLKNLREDLKGDINDFTLQNESRKANALKPLLSEIDNATKYTNGMTEETATDIRRKYALMKTAEANRFVSAGMRPDLTAVTKWVEAEDELGGLLKGQPSIPQKQALHDAAAYHRLVLRQRRSNQNNIGAIEEEAAKINSSPADSRASLYDLINFKLHTTGLGPHIPGFGPLIPKGYPGSTGWLNLNHSGPASVYPLSHGMEQAANFSGRAYKWSGETYEDLKTKYKKFTN